MTAPRVRAHSRPARLAFADPGEAAGPAVFLQRLLRWEKAAVVRLQADHGVLGVFARPARFEVLAVRTARLADGQPALDATVSAGELLEGITEDDASAVLPADVTGPSWTGLLPPRGGWRPLTELGGGRVRQAAADVVAEFRTRSEAMPPDERTRKALDALADEVWDRPLTGTRLPLRAVHAAQALGFLRIAPATPVALHAAGPWLRLTTPHGSVLARPEGTSLALGAGLTVTPLQG
jgi:hypothetical protein